VTPAPDSLRVEIQAVVVVDVVSILVVVAGVVPLPRAALITAKTLVAAATTAVAHAPPTPVSHGKTQVMAQVMVGRHVANVAHQAHALRATISTNVSHVMKCSARTHAAHVSIWETSATILMNASQAAMCQQASHHPVCLRAAVAVAAGAAIAAAVAATSVAAARAPVLVGEILVADFGADQLAA
jgi:hypothetical protein